MALRNKPDSSGEMTRIMAAIAVPVFLLLIAEVTARGPALAYRARREHRAITELIRNRRQSDSVCSYPCPKCVVSSCMAGVNNVRDGCTCCYICARQQGDVCDSRFTCDEEKGLYCDFTQHPSAICRAKAPGDCIVNNITYKDGEEFKANCSQLCTCQNGQYSCSTLCPQEDRIPSSNFCREPQLISVENRCCREWVCPNVNSQPPTGDGLTLINEPGAPCNRESTEWSPCSVSCGMGFSLRVTNENRECQPVQERRLCMIRPCNQDDVHIPELATCKTTYRLPHEVRLQHGNCRSVKNYKPKFCSYCKKHRCCVPQDTETREIEMQCGNNTITEKFMWIKGCECHFGCNSSVFR